MKCHRGKKGLLDPEGAGGGGGGISQSSIRGGSAPKSNALPFHILFWQKRYPFNITFVEKRYSFHIPTLGS